MNKKEITETKQTVLMLGFLCVKSEEGYTLPQKVEILDRFMLVDEDIAIICNCKSQAIRDARQRLKKVKK